MNTRRPTMKRNNFRDYHKYIEGYNPKDCHFQKRKCSRADNGAGALFCVRLLDFAKLFCGICRDPFVADFRIVSEFFAAHPTGTMDLTLCKAAGRSMRPCLNTPVPADTAEKFLLAADGAFALFAIVTSISVQFFHSLTVRAACKSCQRNMLSYRQPICHTETGNFFI